MATIKVTEQNFEQEVMISDIPVIIDFYAEWCGPCKMMGPVFEEVSEEYKGKVKFVKVDTQASQQLAAGFQVQSIPTLAVIHNKKELERWVGFASKDALKQRIEEILAKI